MLKVNRRVYINEPTNEKSKNFETKKNVVQEFLNGLRNLKGAKNNLYLLFQNVNNINSSSIEIREWNRDNKSTNHKELRIKSI